MEAQLIPFLHELFPATGQPVANGDDAVVLRTGPLTAVTVDTQSENIHFKWHWASPRDLGARLVGVVLSDLAAMGAWPEYGILSLLVPKGFPLARAKGFLKGVAARAEQEGLVIAGGDVARGAGFSAILTAFGEAPPLPMRRHAEVDDFLCVSGPIGRAGWELSRLLAGERLKPLRWLRPPSRLKLGQTLSHQNGVHGAMDISDGLFLDAKRMAEAAGLGLKIDFESIPVEPIMKTFLRDAPPKEKFAAIGSGEDYELLVAVRPGDLPSEVTPIGRFLGEGFSVSMGGRTRAWPKTGFLH